MRITKLFGAFPEAVLIDSPMPYSPRPCRPCRATSQASTAVVLAFLGGACPTVPDKGTSSTESSSSSSESVSASLNTTSTSTMISTSDQMTTACGSCSGQAVCGEPCPCCCTCPPGSAFCGGGEVALLFVCTPDGLCFEPQPCGRGRFCVEYESSAGCEGP